MTVDIIVEQIEKEAARRAKSARSAYRSEMAALQARFRAEQKLIESQEKESLKATERWRLGAIASVRPEAPVRLSDIRSVRREVEDGFDKKAVSVPRLSFLEMKGGAA